MASGDNTVSGGLLVVLGIIVALGAVALFYNYSGGDANPDVTINAEMPRTPGNN